MSPFLCKRGFTLVELVIVIVILAVLSMVVVPRYVDMQKDAELAVAERFAAALKEGASNYIVRGVVRNSPVTNITFATYVSFSEPGATQHTFVVEEAVRNTLQNPAAQLLSNGDRTITLDFKSGARATYTIDPSNGEITDTYTGFGDGGGGGCSGSG